MYKKAEKKTSKATAAKKPAKTEAKAVVTPKVTKAAKPALETAKPAAAKNTTATASKPASATSAPSFADIQLRAYFVAEKRQTEGRPGTDHGDWLEAERQLLAERATAPKSKGRAKATA